jgi:hypothetical protein
MKKTSLIRLVSLIMCPFAIVAVIISILNPVPLARISFLLTFVYNNAVETSYRQN